MADNSRKVDASPPVWCPAAAGRKRHVVARSQLDAECVAHPLAEAIADACRPRVLLRHHRPRPVIVDRGIRQRRWAPRPPERGRGRSGASEIELVRCLLLFPARLPGSILSGEDGQTTPPTGRAARRRGAGGRFSGSGRPVFAPPNWSGERNFWPRGHFTDGSAGAPRRPLRGRAPDRAGATHDPSPSSADRWFRPPKNLPLTPVPAPAHFWQWVAGVPTMGRHPETRNINPGVKR